VIAVFYRLRSGLRHRWRAALGMTILVALVISVPLAVAAGARRTISAPDRYAASASPRFDAAVAQVNTRVPRAAEIATLAGVDVVQAYTFVFGGLLAPTSPEPLDALVFTGSFAAGGLRLVSGRAPADASPEEFVATRSFATNQHASIGDQYQLVTLTQEQAATNGFSVLDPQGPTLTARLVGVVDGPAELQESTPLVFFGHNLRDVGDIGLSQTNIAVALDPGVTLEQLRAEIDTLPQPDDFSVSPADMITPTIRRAVDAQGNGLWLLAGVAAVAAIAVLGQLLGRHARVPAADSDALTALGYSGRDRFVEGLGVALMPIVLGTALAIGLSIIPSPLFPTGFARRLEPSTGFRIDSRVIALGAVGAIIALGAWAATSLARTHRRTEPATASTVSDVVAAHAGSPTMTTGLRLAFAPRRSDRGAVAATRVAMLLIAAGAAGALVFGASLNRLVREPARYGSNYDFVIGNQGAETFPQDVTDRLHNDPEVAALTAYAVDHARSGANTIEVLGIDQLVGDGAPHVLTGRLPRSDNEVAFGRVEANRVGARVGQPISLTGASAQLDYVVTGIIVVPGLGPNEGLGQGAVMTMSGLRQIDAEATITSEVVRVRGESSAAQAHLAELVGAPPDGPFQPGAIANVARVRAIPFVVAAFLAMLGVVTVAHTTLSMARSRRRDIAVLRALGADRRWIGSTLHWQATWGVILAAIVGPPLGIVAGRLVFGAFADSMGAIDAAAVPILLFAALAATLLLVANSCAVISRLRARSVPTAVLLRAE
jgi:putative ABC transport system permease protein